MLNLGHSREYQININSKVIIEPKYLKVLVSFSNQQYKDKMPFSNVPVKNPGRYLEQFVKIVQPRVTPGLQGSNPAVQFAGMGNRYNIVKETYLY